MLADRQIDIIRLEEKVRNFETNIILPTQQTINIEKN
jgi:hypothetical protein